jgi:excisionase family DNA binding protein
VAVKTVKKLIRKRKLAATLVAGRYRIRRADLADYLEANTKKATHPEPESPPPAARPREAKKGGAFEFL